MSDTTQPHPSPIPCPTCKTPSSCTVHEECDLRPQEASSLPVVAWRARHISESDMIGHYPWSFQDRTTVRMAVGYQYEALASHADAQSQLTALKAERDKWYQEAAAQAASAIAAHDELAALKAAPVVDVQALTEAGALMANTMFNLAQQTDKFDDYHCELFKSMQVKWDAARSALRSAIEGNTPANTPPTGVSAQGEKP